MSELCHRDTADSLQCCFREAAGRSSPFCIAVTCEGFECCQIETSGSSAQLDVLSVHSTNVSSLLRAWSDWRGRGQSYLGVITSLKDMVGFLCAPCRIEKHEWICRKDRFATVI